MRAKRTVVPVGAIAGGLFAAAVACKGAPAELPASDAAYVRSDAAASALPAPTTTATVTGPLNTGLAQTVGMRIAQERWGVRPKMATAWRMPDGNWRVTVVAQEEAVTANVYLDGMGALLDGGVFGGGDH